MAMSWRCQRSAQLWCDSVSFVWMTQWMTQSSVILEKSHFAEVPIRMLPGSCEIEFYTARCQRQWATPLPRARVTLEAIIETISRCHALTRTRFLPQWDLEGPTYSKLSARALRVQPGGRPCGAGPVTWPQQLLNAGQPPDCREGCCTCMCTNYPCMAGRAPQRGPRGALPCRPVLGHRRSDSCAGPQCHASPPSWRWRGLH